MTTYKLPDWLGGHEVEIVKEHDDGDYTVRTVEYIGAARPRIRVPRGGLIEIQPPSIDDPVELPLEISDHDEDTIKIRESTAPDMPCRAIISFFGEGDNVHLTAEQCRDAARALWALGKESR